MDEQASRGTAAVVPDPLFPFYANQLFPMNRPSAPRREAGGTLRDVPALAQVGKQADRDYSADRAGASHTDCVAGAWREGCLERMVE